MRGPWRGRSRRPLAFFLVLAGILAAAQIVLPAAVEKGIASALARSLGDGGSIRADVRAFPALQLLAGRIGSVDLDVRRIAAGDLVVDRLIVEGRNVKLDLLSLLGGEGLRIEDAGHLRGTIIVSEDDLNEYFASRIDALGSFRVGLEPGRAVVTGTLTVARRQFAVRVEGAFRVESGTSVSFVPLEARIENSVIPEFALMLLAGGWPLSVKLDQDLIPLAVEGVAVEEGRLVVYGSRPADPS